MKVLVTGAGGQLGRELIGCCPNDVELQALNSSQLDITNQDQVSRTVEAFGPDCIINAAAYTAVDKAESEPERAHLVNAIGAENVAKAAATAGARMVNISTDFVFDGHANTPYKESDEPNPLSVYGKTKLEGENRVIDKVGDRAVIIRTSWVYSRFGNNFVKTMLRLMEEKDSLGVVADQVGAPTWAGGLANTIWKVSQVEGMKGLFHWSDSGVASWYDFAVAIYEEALDTGILEKKVDVRPIQTSEYPTPAKRPSYSVLEKSTLEYFLGAPAIHWRTNLRTMLR